MFNKECNCDNKDKFYWSAWIYDVYSGPGTVKNKHRYKIHEICRGMISVETRRA
jgi:hypothetical protein